MLSFSTAGRRRTQNIGCNWADVFEGDSPVLIVLNKIDQNPAYDVNRKFLQSKYPGITSSHRVSSAKGTGIREFKAGLRSTFQRAPILKTRWPTSWFRVKERLENLQKSFVSRKEFASLCVNEGVIESQETLVDFWTILALSTISGICTCLDTHVLDPRWVTEGVYTILNSHALTANKGILALRDLPGMLSGMGRLAGIRRISTNICLS
jgi:internalin A